MGEPPRHTGLEASSDSHTAVVLIHGIGQVASGDVLGAAVKGIGAVLPDVRVLSTDVRVAGRPARRLLFGEAAIDIFEFRWAAIAGAIRLRRPIRAFGRITALVKEFPSMAVGADSSTAMRVLATAIGYTLAALWILWAAALVGSAIELSARTGPWISVEGNAIRVAPVTSQLFNPENGWLADHGYYWSAAASWVEFAIAILAAGCAVLGSLVFLVSWPIRRLRPLNVLMRTSAASAFVAFSFCVGLSLVHVAVVQFVPELVGGVDPVALLLIGATYLAIVAGLLQVALWPANLLRDVVHYLGTDPRGVRLPDHAEIHRQLGDLVTALRQSPALDRLVLVCHSLGTVIVVDFLLAQSAVDSAGPTIPVDLITAGSPIRRLINVLLPNRLPRPLEIRRRLGAGALPVARWFNAYRLFDYVGTRLSPRRLNTDKAEGIRECPLRPRWRWPLGHANYWRDSRFAALVAVEVLRPVLTRSEPAVRSRV